MPSSLQVDQIQSADGNTTYLNSGTLSNLSVDETFSGIMEVDQWYLTGSVGEGDIIDNWARNNFTGFSKIGTGLTQSSGIFTFPRTGVYEIIVSATLQESTGDSDANMGVILKISTDNGNNYYNTAHARGHALSNSYYNNAVSTYILNVNNIAYSGTDGVKFKLNADSVVSGNYVSGSTALMLTNFSIKRLGPAQ